MLFNGLSCLAHQQPIRSEPTNTIRFAVRKLRGGEQPTGML
jgi:hypothetical protein